MTLMQGAFATEVHMRLLDRIFLDGPSARKGSWAAYTRNTIGVVLGTGLFTCMLHTLYTHDRLELWSGSGLFPWHPLSSSDPKL